LSLPRYKELIDQLVGTTDDVTLKATVHEVTQIMTLLFITHDSRLVRYVSHRVVVLYLGRAVEVAETEVLFAEPAYPTRGQRWRRRRR